MIPQLDKIRTNLVQIALLSGIMNLSFSKTP